MTFTPLKDGSLKLCEGERYPVLSWCLVLLTDRR